MAQDDIIIDIVSCPAKLLGNLPGVCIMLSKTHFTNKMDLYILVQKVKLSVGCNRS